MIGGPDHKRGLGPQVALGKLKPAFGKHGPKPPRGPGRHGKAGEGKRGDRKHRGPDGKHGSVDGTPFGMEEKVVVAHEASPNGEEVVTKTVSAHFVTIDGDEPSIDFVAHKVDVDDAGPSLDELAAQVRQLRRDVEALRAESSRVGELLESLQDEDD